MFSDNGYFKGRSLEELHNSNFNTSDFKTIYNCKEMH